MRQALRFRRMQEWEYLRAWRDADRPWTVAGMWQPDFNLQTTSIDDLLQWAGVRSWELVAATDSAGLRELFFKRPAVPLEELAQAQGGEVSAESG
jgi:hypothetical protein